MNKRQIIITTILVIICGTAMHFAHHIPFFNHFLGYIFPINECVWEHMKMSVYPLLGAGIYACCREKSLKPFNGFVAASLLSIPLHISVFYLYWAFTRHSLLLLDIFNYIWVMTAMTLLGIYWGEKSAFLRRYPVVGIVVACAELVLLGWLAYHPLDMIFFALE